MSCYTIQQLHKSTIRAYINESQHFYPASICSYSGLWDRKHVGVPNRICRCPRSSRKFRGSLASIGHLIGSPRRIPNQPGMYIGVSEKLVAASQKGASKEMKMPRLSDRSCEAVWSTGVEFFTPWKKKMDSHLSQSSSPDRPGYESRVSLLIPFIRLFPLEHVSSNPPSPKG